MTIDQLCTQIRQVKERQEIYQSGKSTITNIAIEEKFKTAELCTFQSKSIREFYARCLE